jgi:hypothetical protein
MKEWNLLTHQPGGATRTNTELPDCFALYDAKSGFVKTVKKV